MPSEDSVTVPVSRELVIDEFRNTDTDTENPNKKTR